jgi:hypothetical protein
MFPGEACDARQQVQGCDWLPRLAEAEARHCQASERQHDPHTHHPLDWCARPTKQNKTNARAFLEPFLDIYKNVEVPKTGSGHTHAYRVENFSTTKRRFFCSSCSFLCRGWRERRRYDTGGAHWRRDFRKRGRAGTYTKTHLVCDAVFYPKCHHHFTKTGSGQTKMGKAALKSKKRPMMGFLVGRALGGLRNRAVQIPGAAAACARPLELSAHLQRDHLLILQNDRVCLHAFPLRLL